MHLQHFPKTEQQINAYAEAFLVVVYGVVLLHTTDCSQGWDFGSGMGQTVLTRDEVFDRAEAPA